MSRLRRYVHETYFTCPFCSKTWGGQRRVQRRGFGRRLKPLVEQDDDIQEAYRRAEEDRDAHVRENHGPETIVVRMAEIEREAKWANDYAERTDEELDWATHPLAVEWRALMRAWWALPAQPQKVAILSPTYKRSLISKGPLAPPTPGERHMSKVASHQRKLRLARSEAA